jgi:RNA polymerase sigma factor (sigma-70 family)
MEPAEVLRTVFNVALSQRFYWAYKQDVRRVGPANREDFDALLMLECVEEEEKKGEGRLEEDDVLRVMNRVRHRIVRHLQHRAGTLPLPEMVEARPSSTASHESDFARACREALKPWGPDLLAVFERHFIEGLSNKEIAAELGTSASTVSRRLEKIEEFLRRVMPDPRKE